MSFVHMYRIQTFSEKISVIWSVINSLQYCPEFQTPREKDFLKTLWEKEKILVTSIFSFLHIAFYTPNKTLIVLVMFIMSSANALNLDLSLMICFGEKLFVYKEF